MAFVPLMLIKQVSRKKHLLQLLTFLRIILYVPEDAYVYPYWILGMHPQGI